MRIDQNRRGEEHFRRSRWPSRPLRCGVVPCLASILALAAASVGGRARAAYPPAVVEDLLRLVPADASLVLTIEGLRDHVRSIGASRLAADLRRLPAVKSWLESEKYRHWKRSCSEIEASLGVKLADLRDQVLGDAVVLVLRLPADAPPDPSRARGLLLLRARDPALLVRLIDVINSSQRGSGELARVQDRRRAGTTYYVREFPENSGRPPEWYVGYPDGTFAFSNSEAMIQAVVDRKPPGPSPPRVGSTNVEKPKEVGPCLGDLPKLAAVRRRLPDRALARLYVDPRAIERLLTMAPRPAKPADDRVVATLERHLASVEYAGAALVWRDDAIVVHAVETLDASRVDGWLRRWAGDSRACRAELRRVPKTAIALAAAHVDATALREAIDRVTPEGDHQRLRNMEALATGLLLGQDLASRVLPVLGPGVIAYLDAPADDGEKAQATPGRGRLFPVVLVVDLAGDPGRANQPTRGQVPAAPTVSDALENALRTVLTMMALDEKRGQGRAGLATTEVAGATVTTLSTPIPFAYAIDRNGGRLVLGTSAASVARYLEGASDPAAGARFRELQAVAFPGYETFVCVDLESLAGLAGRYREHLTRNLAARQKRTASDVEKDLEHVLALAHLFRAAFIASRIEPDASAIHRCFGVIVRDSKGRASEQP